MRLKYAAYILLGLAVHSGCLYEELPEAGSGKVLLDIGDLRSEAGENALQTRTNTIGQWIDGDEVTTTVTFRDINEESIETHEIKYRYMDADGNDQIPGTWEVMAGYSSSIDLKMNVRSIRIDAVMEHIYDGDDMEGTTPVRGKETMITCEILEDVVPSGTYTVYLTNWQRTSSLLEVRNDHPVEKVVIKQNHEGAVEMTVTNLNWAFFHINSDIEHMCYVTNEGKTQKYRINATNLVAGEWSVFDLKVMPPENDAFDPDLEYPTVPDYPGYLIYHPEEESDEITYLVVNGEGLKNVYAEANINSPNTNIVLRNHIDMTGVDWIPVPTGEEGFKGTFDGKGYTIKGLLESKFISTSNFGDNTETSVTSEYQCTGLFAYLGEGGVIKNVTIEDVNIDIKAQRPDVDVIVGTIVGINCGRVENCHIIGNPKTEGSTITARGWSVSEMSAAGYDPNSSAMNFDTRVGGIVGMNHAGGQVIGCSIRGRVSITSLQNHFIMAGGVVAYNFGDVVACYADANYFNAPDIRGNYTTEERQNQGIIMHGETDHSDMPVVDVGAIVAYNENKPLGLDSNGNPVGSPIAGKVLACYTNLDHKSSLTSVSNSGGVTRFAALTSTENAEQTTYSYWNSTNEIASNMHAIGNDSATKGSNNTSTIHRSISKVTGTINGTGGHEWGDIVSKMNNAISSYTTNGGCTLRYHNPYLAKPYEETFQPCLYDTNQ